MDGARTRLTDAKRSQLSARARQLYEKGQSVREIAQKFSISYGLTNALLHEAGTPMRKRGGLTTSQRRARARRQERRQ